MRDNITVKPEKIRLINLLEEIGKGVIQIPIFQRDFVWKPNQMIELFDSLIKGYPVGSLLFWRPEVQFKTKRKIGPYTVSTDKANVSYVLDGFQRLTTLFGVLTNPKQFGLYDYNSELKDYMVYYNLKEKEFVYIKSKKEKKYNLIPLYKIVDTYEFIDFLRDLELEVKDKMERNQLIDNAKEISKVLYDYEVPYVEIRGGDIKSAVEIFSRINSTGTDISEDFMLSALSYNVHTNFLFSEAITEFLTSLNNCNFQGLKRDTILNCIANSKGRIYFDVKMEELLKPDLEILTKSAFIHIRKAVNFLYEELSVLDYRLLPYPTQLIFLSEFFRINPSPSLNRMEKLKQWFWITSYSNYFTIYSLSQQREAYRIFCLFASGKHDSGVFKVDSDEELFSTAKFPEKLNYISVRSKVLQLFYINRITADCKPKYNEGVKEFYLFNSKDKSPGNIVLRLDSDFEASNAKRDIKDFILNASEDALLKYFVDERAKEFYIAGKVEEFIRYREFQIKREESLFVDGLGLVHSDFILF